MSDIVTRAEEALAAEWVNPESPTALCYIASELVAELKVARAQRDEFHAQLDDALFRQSLSIEVDDGYGEWGCTGIAEVFGAFGMKPGDTLKEAFELSERLRQEDK